MRRLPELAIRRPRTVLLIAFLAVAALGPGVARLELRTDGHALVPQGTEAVRFDESIRAEFGISDQIVVAVEPRAREDIFNLETLALVERLTRRVQTLEGIDPDEVISLATEAGDRVRTGTLKFNSFLEPAPAGAGDLERVRAELARIRLFDGVIVSRDGTGAAILVGVPDGTDRPDLYRRLQALIEAAGDGAHRMHVVGAPVAESLLGLHLMEDLGIPSAVLGVRTGDASGGDREEPTGLYAIRRLVGRHVGLLPLAIAVMALVFLASFRRPAAAMLPLMEVGAALLMVLGIMGWTGVPVYLTIAVMPVILTAVGIADEIHIFSRYRQIARAEPGRPGPELVRATMAEMQGPVVKTSLTSAVAFLSFALSPIDAVRAFGVFTALGVGLCMLWSLTVVPACLVLVPVGWLVAPARGHGAAAPAGGGAFDLVFRVASSGRLVWIGAAILVVIAAPLGIRRVAVQDSWIDGFAPQSPFRRSTDLINDAFLGTHVLTVVVEGEDEVLSGTVAPDDVELFGLRLPATATGDPQSLTGRWVQVNALGEGPDVSPPEGRSRHRSALAPIVSARRVGDQIDIATERRYGSLNVQPADGAPLTWQIATRPLLDRGVLEALCGLEAFLASRGAENVGGVLGPCKYIATTHFILKASREEARLVPDDPSMLLTVWMHYGRVRGEHRLRQVIDRRSARALVTVFMTNANFADTARLLEAIDAHAAEHLAPHGLSVRYAGDVAVSQTLIAAIVSTQVRSLLLSLLGIVLVTALLGRSLAWGVLCAVPCALAVTVNFAVMGWLEIPLGVATSMFSAMTLGIGIDYAIHLTERFRRAAASGLERAEAVRRAVTVTGPALLVDALAIVLGFGVLIFSQVPANARLGGLLVLAVASCFLATMLVLPAAMSCSGLARRSHRSRSALAGGHT